MMYKAIQCHSYELGAAAKAQQHRIFKTTFSGEYTEQAFYYGWRGGSQQAGHPSLSGPISLPDRLQFSPGQAEVLTRPAAY